MITVLNNITLQSYGWDDLNDTPLGAEYSAYRGWVYVEVKKFREPDVLDLRGGESDIFDPLSKHFIARDRTTGSIIGCTRVIRYTPERLLPALRHFPECLDGRDLDAHYVGEVSRFISTGGSQRTRRDVALLLIRELAEHSLERNRRHVVFLVEEPMRRWLSFLGVPLEPVGPSLWIEEERGELAPYLVDLKECDRTLGAAHQIYAEGLANAADTSQ